MSQRESNSDYHNDNNSSSSSSSSSRVVMVMVIIIVVECGPAYVGVAADILCVHVLHGVP